SRTRAPGHVFARWSCRSSCKAEKVSVDSHVLPAQVIPGVAAFCCRFQPETWFRYMFLDDEVPPGPFRGRIIRAAGITHVEAKERDVCSNASAKQRIGSGISQKAHVAGPLRLNC